MKSFWVVLDFELRAYFKNKVYLISTIVLALILGGILSAPRIIDFFSSDQQGETTEEGTAGDKTIYAYYDEVGLVRDASVLELSFSDSQFVACQSQEELEAMVKDGSAKAGFVIDQTDHFRNYVLDTAIFDYTASQFSEVMNALIQNQWLAEHDIDPEVFAELQTIQISNDEVVLGTDGASNYYYTYVLIMALYMMVLLYGQTIAVAIASEKSNRAVEILATSASSYALIFGKIIAGAVAGIIQFVILLGITFGAYELNSAYWGNALDFLLHIPSDILLSFAVFGLFGYLLYAFIFGMIGAMAQKSEDINSTATPITIVYIIAFIATYMAISSGNEMMMRIVSYVPFSSFMGMFSRMAMTDVPLFEVLLSLVILIASTGLIGLLAAKIYRTGLLMYGNKITFKSIFKQMKNNH